MSARRDSMSVMAIEANLEDGNASAELARLGSTLENRYRILDVLAKGGMGVVYRGERLGLNRQVAVKFLHANFAADVKVRERFERELHAMSRLNHPNCISVIDYGIADSPFIVMEYVNGRTLRHVLIEKGRLPPVRALFIASQILAALHHAHSQDMVHRDIKPGNIIVSDVAGTLDHVYVLDFGLAKFLSSAKDDLTASWMLMGTPSYMAPEQARVGIIGAATDIYSTGVVLFELLTGTKPYVANHPLDIIHMHQTAPVPSIRERVPEANFSAELDLAIQTALAKDPADRFASAGAFARALDLIPEAVPVRTSTKLRALTPPPGYDRPESLQLEALPEEPTPEPLSPPDTIDPVDQIEPVDSLGPIGRMPSAALPDAPALEPLQVRPQGSVPNIKLPSADARPPVTSPATLSTLVPGGLQPRTSMRMPAATPRRQETPLAMASTPIILPAPGGVRSRSSRAWIVLASMSITMIGLVSWYATRDGGEAASTGLQRQLHATALVAPKPAELAPEASAEPGTQIAAQPGAVVSPGAGAVASAEPGVAATGEQPEAAEPATQEIVAAQAAAAPAPEEPAAADTAVAIQAAAAKAEPAAVAPARAQPARPGPVNSIDDIERLLQQGRRDEALQGIIRLRRSNFPRSGYLAFMLGNLYFDKMQWSAGLAAYDDALRLRPEYRGNATLNENAIRALAHKTTWPKVNALYTGLIRQAGAKYLRIAAQSDKNPTVRQRAKQILGRVGRK
jgi:serine/threonine protein kinase